MSDESMRLMSWKTVTAKRALRSKDLEKKMWCEVEMWRPFVIRRKSDHETYDDLGGGKRASNKHTMRSGDLKCILLYKGAPYAEPIWADLAASRSDNLYIHTIR